ncbi:hypothetical protein BLNAU_15647 [Blattamonas nauphoetae]|uniref:Uncharacterized protein n=1 Tax=Blattamonas nauphoetae TaxID=2049346 RepID=A0ABQ9XGP2_9EUKA|nr:hypothetical protein BLNAU_15647 [Blattamonas nauphoetae]
MDDDKDFNHTESTPLNPAHGHASGWHTTFFDIKGNTKDLKWSSRICFCYQTMLNRKRYYKVPNASCGVCFTSFFCNPCCEWILRSDLSNRYNLKFSPFKSFFGAYVCPCLTIWQDAHEITVREEKEP